MKEPTIYMNGKDVPLTEALKTQVKTLEKELAPFKAKEFYKKYEDMITETVTISKKEYESLLEDRKWLAALENAGVDNWEGIDYARELLDEDE